MLLCLKLVVLVLNILAHCDQLLVHVAEHNLQILHLAKLLLNQSLVLIIAVPPARLEECLLLSHPVPYRFDLVHLQRSSTQLHAKLVPLRHRLLRLFLQLGMK
jgi:hypothetical protein